MFRSPLSTLLGPTTGVRRVVTALAWSPQRRIVRRRPLLTDVRYINGDLCGQSVACRAKLNGAERGVSWRRVLDRESREAAGAVLLEKREHVLRMYG